MTSENTTAENADGARLDWLEKRAWQVWKNVFRIRGRVLSFECLERLGCWLSNRFLGGKDSHCPTDVTILKFTVD